MKVKLNTNIDKNKFPNEYKPLMEMLAGILNTNFKNLYDVLSNNLTIPDNFKGEIKEIKVKLDSNNSPLVGGTISIKSSTPIVGMNVLKAVNMDNNNVFPLSHPFISFSQTGNRVTIQNITGLQPAALYSLTVNILE